MYVCVCVCEVPLAPLLHSKTTVQCGDKPKTMEFNLPAGEGDEGGGGDLENPGTLPSRPSSPPPPPSGPLPPPSPRPEPFEETNLKGLSFTPVWIERKGRFLANYWSGTWKGIKCKEVWLGTVLSSSSSSSSSCHCVQKWGWKLLCLGRKYPSVSLYSAVSTRVCINVCVCVCVLRMQWAEIARQTGNEHGAVRSFSCQMMDYMSLNQCLRKFGHEKNALHYRQKTPILMIILLG